MSTTSDKKTTAKKSVKKKAVKKVAAKKKAVKEKVVKKETGNKKSTDVKKTAVKKSTKKSTNKSKNPSGLDITAEKRWRMIAEAAYHKAEKRNFAPGNELGDWAEAEKEIEKLING